MTLDIQAISLSTFFLSTHNFSGFLPKLNIFSNACDTDLPLLSFNITIHPYFEKTSITHSKYLKPLLYLLKACISTKSAAHILSRPLTSTFLLRKCFVTGLCNSSASASVNFISFLLFLSYL